jgi:hypothetical protein
MRTYGRTQEQVYAGVPKVMAMKRNDDDFAIRVCIYCGSPRPEELLQQCAHGIVATVRGAERRAAAQLFVEFQAMHAARAALMMKLDKAVESGRATIDHAPAFDNAGENVVPFHERAIIIARGASR